MRISLARLDDCVPLASILALQDWAAAEAGNITNDWNIAEPFESSFCCLGSGAS